MLLDRDASGLTLDLRFARTSGEDGSVSGSGEVDRVDIATVKGASLCDATSVDSALINSDVVRGWYCALSTKPCGVSRCLTRALV